MSKKIQEIIELLDKSEKNLDKTKIKLSDYLEEVGYQIEATREQKALWFDLDQLEDIPIPVTASGYNLAKTLEQSTSQMAFYVDDGRMEQAIYTASSAGDSGVGTVASAATLSYPPDQLPQSYYRLDSMMNQRIDQSTISERLQLIDSTIAQQYKNAWQALYSTDEDPTRAPMFLMREVLTQLYHHFAPDDKVKEFLIPNNKEKITRKNRIDYIASIMDSWKKQTFLLQEKAFLDIYQELSSAHKHGNLDVDKSKGFLYQANSLIKLLLDSVFV